MTALPTIGLVSLTDGRLMGEISTVYDVLSHLVGRPVFTHELPRYSKAAKKLIEQSFPAISSRLDPDWQIARDKALASLGDAVEPPAAWAGALADDNSPFETLAEAFGDAGS